MIRIERSALVGHSARRMFELVAAVERYPEFLPWCHAASIDSKAADTVCATLHIEFHGLRQSFSTQNVLRPHEGIELRLVRGPFRSLDGRWRFQALAPDASKVALTLEYEFSNPMLGRLVGPVFNHIAETMVDAFVRRADAPGGAP